MVWNNWQPSQGNLTRLAKARSMVAYAKPIDADCAAQLEHRCCSGSRTAELLVGIHSAPFSIHLTKHNSPSCSAVRCSLSLSVSLSVLKRVLSRETLEVLPCPMSVLAVTMEGLSRETLEGLEV